MEVSLFLHSNIRSGGNLLLLRHAAFLGSQGHHVCVVFLHRFFPKSIDFLIGTEVVNTWYLDESPPTLPCCRISGFVLGSKRKDDMLTFRRAKSDPTLCVGRNDPWHLDGTTARWLAAAFVLYGLVATAFLAINVAPF